MKGPTAQALAFRLSLDGVTEPEWVLTDGQGVAIMTEIVVGVDGSQSAKAALRWAVQQGQLTGAAVRAIQVLRPASGYTRDSGVPKSLQELRDETQRALDDVVAEIAPTERDQTAGKVITEVVSNRQNNVAGVLADYGRHADLLVVGSRGLGGFNGLMLGSVSQQLVQHAPCPVVVIPPHESSDR